MQRGVAYAMQYEKPEKPEKEKGEPKNDMLSVKVQNDGALGAVLQGSVGLVLVPISSTTSMIT
jgi:hypothetical protein